MSLWFRTIQHLLPRGQAWRVTAEKNLRNLFLAFAEAPATFRTFVDEIWEEVFPEYTTHLEEWEREFGIFVAASETTSARRDHIDAAWKSQGGQDPTYIENILHDAGFTDLYVHECWSTVGPPTWVARDPRNYTDDVAVGLYQCDATRSTDQPQCSTGIDTSGGVTDGDPIFQWQCNNLLANDPGYLVNKDLTLRAPPAVPDDEDTWPYFIYISGETLEVSGDDDPLIPAYRRAELERLLLKVCPAQHWIVLKVDFVNEGVFDESFDASFE